MEQESQAAAETVRHQQALADAATATARQQAVLEQAFTDVGIQGVKSMSELRSAIQGAASGSELEALGSALKAAFDKGALGAEEYQKALDEIKAKQDGLAAQARGAGTTGGAGSYNYLLDPATLEQQFAGNRQQVIEYIRVWTESNSDPMRALSNAIKAYDNFLAAQVKKKKADYLQSLKDAAAQKVLQDQWDAEAAKSAGAAGTAAGPAPAAAAPVATAPSAPAATNVSINIAGILDVNDPVTLQKLASRLAPVLADLLRQGA
jgi:hypothetical protein